MTKQRILLLVLMTWISGVTSELLAQSSELLIMDLYVMLAPASDPNAAADQLQIGFKVNQADQTDEVVLHLDQGGTQKIVVPVRPYRDGYAMWHNSRPFPIQGYEATLLLPFSSEEYASLKHVALYVRDKNGRTTKPLTFDF